MSDIHPQTPTEIAAQLWCLPQHATKVMDPDLCESIVKVIAREQSATDAWYDTAAQMCRNTEYYRDLCVQIGEAIGEQAYIADDGSRSQDVLCAKLPGLVRALLKTT
jgi:hypothetical protein